MEATTGGWAGIGQDHPGSNKLLYPEICQDRTARMVSQDAMHLGAGIRVRCKLLGMCLWSSPFPRFAMALDMTALPFALTCHRCPTVFGRLELGVGVEVV